MSHAYAVVGIESYQQSAIPGINYAHADAKAMASVFEECFGVSHLIRPSQARVYFAPALIC